jgi:hypothetical protein
MINHCHVVAYVHLLTVISSLCIHTVILGAALFRRDTTLKANMTFALGEIDRNPTLVKSPTELFDGIFFKGFSNLPGIKKTVIRRTLMMHL